MIEVSHIGNYDGNVPEGTVLVQSDADYVKTCRLSAERALLKAPLKIWVRLKSHFFWLRNFTEQAGIDCAFSEKTPRTILAEKWNVTLPDWLDDEMVTSRTCRIWTSHQNIQRALKTLCSVFFLDPFFMRKK